ncbi:effector-associated constant component EACC1 [Actinophytocola sp.]|uniref:effector-associated constant component EACC1 n=1 Tax=Actinophytocola sp. TaxID=1872138 RepID=UPI00389B3259
MTPTVARLRLLTGDHDDLLSLHAWLTAEDALRGSVLVERARPRDHQTGTITDVLVIALGAGGAVTALARSVAVWLRHHAGVTIEVRDSHGPMVELAANGAADVEDLIESTLDTRRG